MSFDIHTFALVVSTVTLNTNRGNSELYAIHNYQNKNYQFSLQKKVVNNK